MENVPGAPLRPGTSSCAAATSAWSCRRRPADPPALVWTSWHASVSLPEHDHHAPAISIAGHGTPAWQRQRTGHVRCAQWRQIMRMPWATRAEPGRGLPARLRRVHGPAAHGAGRGPVMAGSPGRRQSRPRWMANYGPQRGTTYLIHIDPPYKHAHHYTGWTDKPVLKRFADHVAGRGALLTRVAVQAGCTLTLVRVWPDTTKDREDSLKHQGGARRFAPSAASRPPPPACPATRRQSACLATNLSGSAPPATARRSPSSPPTRTRRHRALRQPNRRRTCSDTDAAQLRAHRKNGKRPATRHGRRLTGSTP